MIRILFSRKWLITTSLVFLAVVLMIRLGVWQLDRLEQRRNFNNHFRNMLELEPFELTAGTLDADLENMEYRKITVIGEYDTSQEVAIRNQSWNNQVGVHLLTPLKIKDSQTAVFVDRGWIPLDDFQSGNWNSFAESGQIEIMGVIRLPQSEPSLGGRPDPTPLPGETRKAWNFVNTASISAQISYPILSIYIQQSPEPDRIDLPYRSEPKFEISNGPHLSYAIQWFLFASILLIGYPIFIRREIKESIETHIE